MNRIVLIGDIVGSQNHPDRRSLQEQLKREFNAISKNRKGILSPYTLTLGDEFQAVYGNARSLFSDTISILSNAYPAKIRFSIGTGEIITKINHQQALGMDGGAFYNARNGLETLKHSGYYYKIISDHEEEFTFSNKVLDLLSYLMQNWNNNRLKILTYMLRTMPVKDISGELGLSSVAIYKNIKMGALSVVVGLLNDITREIDDSLTR